jgi:Putative peptidoglycan binding domain
MDFQYGTRELKRRCKGADVEELQVRLAGFRGTVPDGDFGPGTERQVMTFQQDVMKITPTGVADRATLRAIDAFARRFPIDFKALKCPCGKCKGFGRGRFKGSYVPGKPKAEAFHLYEYPGVHRMLLWAVRAAFFYLPQHRFVISSGYRCAEDNKQHGRASTNHHGKAIDLDVPLGRGESKRDDMLKCDAIRGRLVETAHAQVGWEAANRKALEPSHIAPTWVHYDVRCYEPKYLQDRMFCTSLRRLDDRRPVRF